MKLFSVISSVLLISVLFLNTAAADPYRVQPIIPGVITIPPVPSYNYGYTAPTPPPAASYGYTAPAPVFNYTPPPNVIIPNEPIVIYRPPTGPSFYDAAQGKDSATSRAVSTRTHAEPACHVPQAAHEPVRADPWKCDRPTELH